MDKSGLHWHNSGLGKAIREEFRKGSYKGIQQGRQEGIINGLLEGIELALEVMFAADGLTLWPLIQRIEAPEKLKAVKEGVRMAKDVPQFKALILEIEKVQ